MIRAVLAAILTVAGLALAPTTAHAEQRAGLPGYCPDTGGVTVIVDFQELGGTTIIRCAPGDQATGLTALKNAGIAITGTQRWGEGFICRIEGKPGPESEACVNTPPASAYWSYWYAPNGGAWKYSELGVLNRKPPTGTFEGWSFSLNKTATTNPPPRIGPRRPDAPPPPAPPPPGNPPPAPPAPHIPAGPGPGPAAGGVAPPAGSAPPATTTPAPSSSASMSATAPVSGTAGGVAWSGEVDRTATDQPSGNSPVGLLIGAGIVLLFAAGAGLITLRRKRSARQGGP